MSSLAPRVAVAITGHRSGNAAYAAHTGAVHAQLQVLFGAVAEVLPGGVGRLYSLLADGVDQAAAEVALDLGWDVVAPLPFGSGLNLALAAEPSSVADAHRLLAGREPSDPASAARARDLKRHLASADVVEPAERDEPLTAAWLAALGAPNDRRAAEVFDHLVSRRYARAAEVMIEVASFVVAVWDGRDAEPVGGTGHSLKAALDRGRPVVWIDPARPSIWRLPKSARDMSNPSLPPVGPGQIQALVRALRNRRED